MPQYELSLSPIQLKVRLGCYPDERETPQTVDCHIKLKFKQMPQACTTDNIADTICYQQLSNELQAACDQREFKLIEYLSAELIQQINGSSPLIEKVSLKVIKNPPLDNVPACAFSIIDE